MEDTLLSILSNLKYKNVLLQKITVRRSVRTIIVRRIGEGMELLNITLQCVPMLRNVMMEMTASLLIIR
jgi:hypothetical protein